MKKFFMLILIPFLANANCPYSFQVEGDTYCMQIEWLKAEKRQRGMFHLSNQDSPFLNPNSTSSRDRLFSQAEISIWLSEDPKQTLLAIDGFRVFPWMWMMHGHSHGANSQFFFQADSNKYLLRELNLQSMPGCWTLRWTIGSNETPEYSSPIQEIINFSNLNAAQREEQRQMCLDSY